MDFVNLARVDVLVAANESDVIAGLTAGIIVWFLASHRIASSIAWVEDTRPESAGLKRLQVGEAFACGALILASFALAYWIICLLSLQVR